MLIAIQGVTGFFVSHAFKKHFLSFRTKVDPSSLPSFGQFVPSFFSTSYSSLRKHTFFNNPNLISFLAFIVNLNTLMVFPGFRFRLKWVFRQYDSEVIEFWGFNVEREMKKKNTENDLYLWLMAKMNEWMNECMVSTLVLLDLSGSDGSVSLGNESVLIL